MEGGPETDQVWISRRLLIVSFKYVGYAVWLLPYSSRTNKKVIFLHVSSEDPCLRVEITLFEDSIFLRVRGRN